MTGIWWNRCSSVRILITSWPASATRVSLIRQALAIDESNQTIGKIGIQAAEDTAHFHRDTLAMSVAALRSCRWRGYSDCRLRLDLVSDFTTAQFLADRIGLVLEWDRAVRSGKAEIRRQPARLMPGGVHFQIDWGRFLRRNETNLDPLNPGIYPVVQSITFVTPEAAAYTAPAGTVGFAPGAKFVQPRLAGL